jgi:hypothetical protein
MAEYFDKNKAKDIVDRIEMNPVFYPGFGAKCPLCGEYAQPASGIKNGKRYHKCRECGHSFSSICP